MIHEYRSYPLFHRFNKVGTLMEIWYFLFNRRKYKKYCVNPYTSKLNISITELSDYSVSYNPLKKR